MTDLRLMIVVYSDNSCSARVAEIVAFLTL